MQRGTAWSQYQLEKHKDDPSSAPPLHIASPSIHVADSCLWDRVSTTALSALTAVGTTSLQPFTRRKQDAHCAPPMCQAIVIVVGVSLALEKGVAVLVMHSVLQPSSIPPHCGGCRKSSPLSAPHGPVNRLWGKRMSPLDLPSGEYPLNPSREQKVAAGLPPHLYVRK